MNASSTGLCVLFVLAIAACGNTQPLPGASLSGSAQLQKPAKSRPAASRSAGVFPRAQEKPPELSANGRSDRALGASTVPSLPFPADLPLHTPLDVPLEGDRDLRVAHAPGDAQKSIIYLHGMCGDSRGADPWIDLATQHATVITVRANIKCPDRPGYKWPQEPGEIQPRIDAALKYVKQLRNGHLETDQVTLIGYSQGSHRGEKLAAAFPEMYEELVLGGPPTAADPTLLKKARSVAILGGELEDTTHMMQGLLNLETAGIRSKFFLLPQAPHGTYGPEGRRVMKDVLSWIWPQSD